MSDIREMGFVRFTHSWKKKWGALLAKQLFPRAHPHGSHLRSWFSAVAHNWKPGKCPWKRQVPFSSRFACASHTDGIALQFFLSEWGVALALKECVALMYCMSRASTGHILALRVGRWGEKAKNNSLLRDCSIHLISALLMHEENIMLTLEKEKYCLVE